MTTYYGKLPCGMEVSVRDGRWLLHNDGKPISDRKLSERAGFEAQAFTAGVMAALGTAGRTS